MKDNSNLVEEHQCRRKLELDIMIEDEKEDNAVKFNSNQHIESIHSRIPDKMIPKLDVEFETEAEAYNFYNAYAYEVGFSIRRSKGHKDDSGKMINRTFCCSCEGQRESDKRRLIIKNPRAQTRFGCLAKIKINCRQSGKYRIVEFIATHTHVTSTPSKSHLHRSQRKLTAAQEAEIDLADDTGIAPKQSCELMARRAGGCDSLGFTHDDYRNYLRTKRTIRMKLHETGGVLEYLQHMQLEDPSFFYALQLDSEGLVTNIFWTDSLMRLAYTQFGDVLFFDTTYKKNQEGRPFAMFVGVNHHKQTIIFGAALLYDETAETFVWLFDTFVQSMEGKKPRTILTDQDAAMAKALSLQWPETHHRICIWHLYQNAAKHLSGVFQSYKEFSKDFSRCIYDYEEEEEFIRSWNEMLEKYELEDNDWLRRMFSFKEKWALVYGRDTFCADMITTQRSESMNSSLKGYVSYKHDLTKFFHHFQRLVENRRYEELKADFRATQSSVSLSLDISILKHAANIYTPQVFKIFESELGKAYDRVMEKSVEVGTMIEYKLRSHGSNYCRTVKCDSANGTVICSCKKFEFSGILCSHILKVLSSENIMKIPSQYILKRWTKNAKMGTTAFSVSKNSSANEDPKAKMANRYRELCRLQTHIATRGSETEEAYNIVGHGFSKILEQIDVLMRRQNISATSTNTNKCDENNIIDGVGKVTGIKHKDRVRGSSTRLRSALEKCQKRKKRVQTQRVSGNLNMNEQTRYEEPTLDVNVSTDHNASELTSVYNLDHIESHADFGDLTSTSSLVELLQQVQRGPELQ